MKLIVKEVFKLIKKKIKKIIFIFKNKKNKKINFKPRLEDAKTLGIIMNITNPKVGLFFWIFFPNFLFSKTIIIPFQYIILCSIFIFQVFIIFFITAYFSSRASNILRLEFLKPINGLILIALAFYILLS